jgi:dCMP deaminase
MARIEDYEPFKVAIKEKDRNLKWHRRFVEMAELVATWSKDESTKVGCVIVGPNKEVRSVGYNGFPRGVMETPKRLVRPEKYLWTEHSERNAIYNAARMGLSLEGCTLYSSWIPCMDCARAIIQSGIVSVYGKLKEDINVDKWGEHFAHINSMFNEAGVDFYIIP